MFEEKKQDNKEYSKNKRLDIRVARVKKDSKFIMQIIKYKRVFVFFEIIILFLVFYIFLLGPQIAKTITNKQVLFSNEQLLEEAKSFKLKVEELQKERDSVVNQDQNNQNIKKLYEVLPRKQNLPEIMAQIDALVKDYGLVLGSIQIENPQEDSDSENDSMDYDSSKINGGIKTIQVSIFVLGGDGSYEKVKELLDGLEKHVRLIDITSFSFDPQMTTYSIIFKTYYLDQ